MKIIEDSNLLNTKKITLGTASAGSIVVDEYLDVCLVVDRLGMKMLAKVSSGVVIDCDQSNMVAPLAAELHVQPLPKI